MLFIDTIDKKDKREGVILLGRGPSTDKLNIKQLNKQTKYDICTIADSSKIVNNPTYAFHYHFASIRRCFFDLHKYKYLLINDKVKECMEINILLQHHKKSLKDYPILEIIR